MTNGIIIFLNEAYMNIATGFFVNCFYIKADTPGNTYNSLFTVFIGGLIVFYPFLIVAFFYSFFNELDRHDFM